MLILDNLIHRVIMSTQITFIISQPILQCSMEKFNSVSCCISKVSRIFSFTWSRIELSTYFQKSRYFSHAYGGIMGQARWACSFCPHFSTELAKDLGLSSLMCLPRVAPFFMGMEINIIFIFLDLWARLTLPSLLVSGGPRF